MADTLKELSVGKMRQQSALCDAERRVVLIPSEELKEVLGSRKIVITNCYPDTTGEDGEWNGPGTFKIEATIT